MPVFSSYSKMSLGFGSGCVSFATELMQRYWHLLVTQATAEHHCDRRSYQTCLPLILRLEDGCGNSSRCPLARAAGKGKKHMGVIILNACVTANADASRRFGQGHCVLFRIALMITTYSGSGFRNNPSVSDKFTTALICLFCACWCISDVHTVAPSA